MTPLKPLRECSYRLLDWIEPYDLDWVGLVHNSHPEAVRLVQKYRHTKCCDILRHEFLYNVNPNVFAAEYAKLIATQPDPRQWSEQIWWALSCNQNDTIERLLDAHPVLAEMQIVSRKNNHWTLQFLRKYPDKICWDNLSMNCSEWAIAQLKANPDKINWSGLSANSHPWAVKQLLANLTRIDYMWFSGNSHYLAQQHLLANMDKIDWGFIVCNKFPLSFYRTYRDKIKWSMMSKRRDIFEDDWEIQARQWFRDEIAAEMMAKMWAPSNMAKFPGWGEEIDADMVAE